MSKTIEGTRLVIKVDSAAIGVLGDLVDRLREGGALNSLDNLSAEVEQFTVEACESCEAEITKGNPERECPCCEGQMCDICMAFHGRKQEVVCPVCAEDPSQ